MSSLKHTEKCYLEKLLSMNGGYVLDFTDATFYEFFKQHDIDIHGDKYQTFGKSKAKKLRAFWDLEPDQLVGMVMSEMLSTYEAVCEIDGRKVDKKLLETARKIVGRLTGRATVCHTATTESEFLTREFSVPDIQKMPIDEAVMPIVKARLEEIHLVLQAGAHLSVIFLCGSVLEAILLGAATRDPELFNRADAAPKAMGGSPKKIPDWSLAQLIDVACDVDILKPDIQKFSHGLRDFRNYIHPYQQMNSGFTPDEHTAKLCFQVLKAAMASLAGERS